MESLSKLLSSSAEDCFDRGEVLSNKEVFFNDFPCWSENVLVLRQKNRQQCQTSDLLAQRNIFFKKNNVRKKKHSLVFFRLWAINAGKLPKKLLAAFSKLKITYPGDQILSNFLMFDDSFCKFPTFLAEIFWKVCRNSFPWGQKIVLKEKKTFEQRSVLFVNFGFRAKKV